MRFPSAVLLLLVLIFCGHSLLHAQNNNKIRIGVSTALSGEGATWGWDVRDGIAFAAETLAPGKFELVFEDDRCGAKEAVSVAHKFIEVDKVDYVLGLACSTAALASAPLYERAKKVTIIVSASSPKISHAGEYIFRTFPGDLAAASLLAEKMQARFKRVAIISAESDYAQDFKSAFIASEAGKKMAVLTEDYLPSTTDFRAILLKLRGQKPEALFINTQYETTFALILKQLKQIDWDLPRFGAYWPSSPALHTVAAAELEGVEFIDTPSLGEILNSEGQQLFRKYVEKYGKIRSIEAVFATCFESVNALNQAIESGKDVREYLATSSFKGIIGTYSFDKNGDVLGIPFSFKKFEGGKVLTQ